MKNSIDLFYHIDIYANIGMIFHTKIVYWKSYEVIRELLKLKHWDQIKGKQSHDSQLLDAFSVLDYDPC